MKSKLSRVLIFFSLLAPTAALAQKHGAGPPPPQAPQWTNDEKERAKTAAEWRDMIERARNNLPQHPPDPVFKFPSKNAKFLVTLRYAENPRAELEKYMVKLWTEATDKRAGLDGLWQEAEKPAWARAAIEDFFKRRTGGIVALHVAPEPAKAAAAPEPAKAAAPEPATLVAASPAPKAER